MQGIPLLILAFAVFYHFFSVFKALAAIQYRWAHIYLLSSPQFNSFLPKIWGTSFGTNYLFVEKYKFFELAGWDVCALVGILPSVETTLLLADAEAVKEVTTTSRGLFVKQVENSEYKAMSFFGPNILVSEHENWKKYRKISAPGFSERNNKLVWEETITVMQSLFNDLWKGQDTISVDHFHDITLNIALFVIGAAGFGRRISWKEEGTTVPPNHTMSFDDTLHVTTKDFIFKLLVPSWALGLTPRLRKVKAGFEEVRMYIAEMMRERELEVEKSERNDLLSNLLEANDHDANQVALTEDELISNIYTFLIAGHETTANALCFAFALLALYPDEQEKIFEQIKSITKGRPLTYADMPHLTHPLAVIYETLRMFPPGPGLPKAAAEDTSLVTGNIHGEKKTIPVPKGTQVIIDVIGLHYNPRYWKDPYTFNPSRFLAADWPRDAFMAFNSGPRGCIGRKFAETEAIAALSILVSQFKVTIKEEPQFAAETFEQRKARILSLRFSLTLTPARVPLVFTRREATP